MKNLFICICFFSIKLSFAQGNSSLPPKYVKETAIESKFIGELPFEKFIEEKFSNDIKPFSKFLIFISLNKKGQLTKVDLLIDDKIKSSKDSTANKIKKYIIANCKWQPAYYKLKKGRRLYIPDNPSYTIKYPDNEK